MIASRYVLQDKKKGTSFSWHHGLKEAEQTSVTTIWKKKKQITAITVQHT